MADRYCRNCGQEIAEDDRFCANCGTPVHEAAHMPTPEAERPGVPPAAERNTWERLSGKQRIPITVSPEQAMEELRQSSRWTSGLAATMTCTTRTGN